MDRPHLAALSCRIDRALARRSLLHAVFLAVLPGVGRASELDAARKRKRCRAPKVRCGKKCLPAGTCCTNAECAAVTGQVCSGKQCVCPGGLVQAGNACVAHCTPACGECQRCDVAGCVNLADGAPCPGGICRNAVCKPDRSLGCTAAQNSCGAAGPTLCPAGPANRFCVVDADGDPVCGVLLCTNDPSGGECPSLTGAGSFVVPCAAICVPAANKTHMCVKPIVP